MDYQPALLPRQQFLHLVHQATVFTQTNARKIIRSSFVRSCSLDGRTFSLWLRFSAMCAKCVRMTQSITRVGKHTRNDDLTFSSGIENRIGKTFRGNEPSSRTGRRSYYRLYNRLNVDSSLPAKGPPTARPQWLAAFAATFTSSRPNFASLRCLPTPSFLPLYRLFPS